jgi:uncharacterized protein (DUF4415 family)
LSPDPAPLPGLTDLEEEAVQRSISRDADNPELTDEQIAAARPFAEVFPDLATSLRKPRGRPRTGSPKKLLTLRLDNDVIEAFRSSGVGWQARMNAALRKAAGL